MKRVNLTGAHLEYSNLSNCDLREVALSDSEFAGRHSNTVLSVSFSPDGRLLVSASLDGIAKVWDVETFSLLRTLSVHSDSVNSVSFSKDGRLLASASADRSVKLWDVGTFSLLTTLTDHSYPVYSVSFSADGRLLASGGQDNVLKVILGHTPNPPGFAAR